VRDDCGSPALRLRLARRVLGRGAALQTCLTAALR
jgi:hypothetical protein